MTQDVDELKRRRIRSFVIRSGRMTTGQQKAYDQGWPEYGLTVDQGILDFEALFGRECPRVLEIGFGMGKSLAQMAAQEPDTGFVGVEVHPPGIGGLLLEMEQHNVSNVRMYCHDAVEVLEHCIPESSLDRVQLFFPDPWHKKRHHKRRLVQPKFVDLIRTRLKVGGVFHMATDWENYAEHMMKVMSAAPGYQNVMDAGEYAPRPDSRPVTKFEKRGERLGHGVWDLLFKRTD